MYISLFSHEYQHFLQEVIFILCWLVAYFINVPSQSLVQNEPRKLIVDDIGLSS